MTSRSYRSIERLQPNFGKPRTDAPATTGLSLSDSRNLALLVWLTVYDQAIKRAPREALPHIAKHAHVARSR